MELVVETPLPAQPGSAHEARQAVGAGLAGWSAVETAELLASELVTNAVLHAASPLVLRVLRDRDEARLEVSDGSPALPMPEDPAPDELGGRGLLLVEALASRWGVVATGGAGKTVWCAIRAGD